jgi:DME family drug/metabolite transporter
VITKSTLEIMPPLALSALTFSVAALLLAPIFAPQLADTVAMVAGGWPWLLYLGVVPTALAYWLYTRGLQRVSATTAAVVGLLEPLTATLLGALLFDELLGVLGALGAALLLMGVTLLALPGNRSAAADAGR